MSDNEQPIEWFLARDGKQHGPLSDIEMRKIVELGHLRPTDLIWRQGLVEWTPGAVVFPSTSAAEAEPAEPKVEPEPKAVQQQQQAQQAAAPAPTATPQPQPGQAALQPQQPQFQPRQQHQQQHQQQSAPATHAAPAPGPSMQAAVADVATHLEQPRTAGPAPAAAPTAPAHHQRGQRDVRAAIAAAQWDRPMPSPANGPHSGPQPAPQPRMQQQPMPQNPGGVPMHSAPHPQQMPQPQMPGPQAPGMARAAPMPSIVLAPRMSEPGRPRPVPVPPPQGKPQSPRPIPAQAGAYDLDEPEERPRRRFPTKTVAAFVILSALGGAAYALHKTGHLPMPLASGVSNSTSTAATDDKSVPVARAPKVVVLKEPALINIGTTAAEIDEGLQKSTLWKLVKREFSQWYGDRVAEASKMRAEQKDEKEVSAFLTKHLVDLRRRNADAVLAASPERLMLVAASFVENLSRLAKHSTEACYGYISQGESSPLVLDLIRSPEHTSSLQAQFKAIIEAAAEGRKTPKLHKAPQREDYDVLAIELTKLKWSSTDLQTFSDARALAQAAPAKVCQMVQDWFLAQLAVKDDDIKIRLLVEALKPVVAG